MNAQTDVDAPTVAQVLLLRVFVLTHNHNEVYP
jgi:hypothetical protein